MQKRPHASVVFCTCFCQDIQNNITFPKLVVQRLPVIISTDFQCFLYIYRYTRICIFTYVYPYISLYSPIPLTLISICWALGIIYNPPAPLVPPDCGEPCCIAYLCGSSTRAFSLYGTSGPGASNVLPLYGSGRALAMPPPSTPPAFGSLCTPTTPSLATVFANLRLTCLLKRRGRDEVLRRYMQRRLEDLLYNMFQAWQELVEPWDGNIIAASGTILIYRNTYQHVDTDDGF